VALQKLWLCEYGCAVFSVRGITAGGCMGFLAIGLKILPLVVEAIQWVEKFVTSKGQYKQDAAVYMIKSFLGVAEQGTNKDLLDDDQVEIATRAVIDAVVALQNVIASKHASP
tara:strand:+ start:254 stop:592 length:339 start_codon:yes stop_codon:yes gene_type:complete